MTDRYCINCRHFDDWRQQELCRRPVGTIGTVGQPGYLNASAYQERRSERVLGIFRLKCGPQARFYQPRPTTPPPVPSE